MAQTKIATVVFLDDHGAETRSPTESSTSMVWRWADGKQSEVQLKDFPDHILRIAAAHGLKQKIGDEYAGADDVEMARGLATNMVERLRDGGDWNRRAEGMAKETILAKACAAAFEVDISVAIAKLADLTKDQRKAVRDDPKVAAEYERIQLERQKEKAEKARKEAQEVPATDIAALFA